MFTASNAVPGTVFSWSRSSSFQRVSAAPLMYHDDPLSATIIPYVFNACRITSDSPWKPASEKLAFNRNRRPIGGSAAFVDDEA